MIKNIVKQYPALISLAIFFTLFSVSNVVYFTSHHIIEYPLPDIIIKLAQIFRASGRFFWIVGYLILFAALAGAFKYHNKKLLVCLLSITLLLQWIDLKNMRGTIMTQTTQANAYDDSIWLSVFSHADGINLYPPARCGSDLNEGLWLFQRLAAHFGKTFNTGYFARYTVDCDEKTAIFHESFQSRQAYVLSWRETQNIPLVIPSGFSQAMLKNECIEYQEILVCIPDLKQSEADLITKAIKQEARLL